MTGPWSSRCTSVGRADAWLIDVVLGKEVADDYRIVVQARPDAIRRLLTSTRHWTACRRSAQSRRPERVAGARRPSNVAFGIPAAGAAHYARLPEGGRWKRCSSS